MDIQQLKSGHHWALEIAKAIRGCRVFLLFLSTASAASESVVQEVQLAYQKKRRILILKLDDTEIPSEMDIPLAGIQWINYGEDDWLESLINSIEVPETSAPVDTLFHQAVRLNIQGDAGQALQLFKEVKASDPHYPGIDKEIRNIEFEYERGWVNRYGRIDEGKLKAALPALKPPPEYPSPNFRIPVPYYAVAVTVMVLIVAGLFGYRYFLNQSRVLWNFKENAQAWLPQVQTKPEDTATNALWDPAAGKLQADFDFKQVQPGTLAGDLEPRATYYVRVPLEDWSAFRSLAFEMKNLSAHDLKVNFSVSQGGCWYEFGAFQNLPQMSQAELKFDLTKPYYKTCEHGDKYAYPAPPFNGVWRFDIILGTDEKPYHDVNGSVLIDNVRLTDRVSNFIPPFEKAPIPTSTATMELAPTNTPTPEPSPSSTSTEIPPTFTVTPYICPYQGKTDEETIANLIEAEAAAVNTEDLEVMTVIFAPNAIFRQENTDPPKIWYGPIARYQEDLFANTDLKDVEHFDILPAEPVMAGDKVAYFTSGSRGKYLNKEGVWVDYFNGSLISLTPTQYGSDHWKLKKDDKGCWVIVQMDFNAGHIEFP